MQTQVQIGSEVKIHTFLHEKPSTLIFCVCAIKGQNEKYLAL